MFADEITPAPNADGSPNLLVHGVALHSRRKPELEAERLCTELEALLARTNDPILVLGIGCGYLLQAARGSKTLRGLLGRRVFFFEPLAGARRFIMPQIAGAPAGILTDEEALRATCGKLGRLTLFALPQWRRLWVDLEDRVRLLLTSRSAGTQRRFFRTWTRNFFRRLDRCAELVYLLEAPTPTYSTVLHCGADPNLFDHLREWQHALQDPATLVTAVDTALPALLGEGIEPDLALSVDSGPGTAWHLFALGQLTNLPTSIPFLTWSAGSDALETFARETLHYRSSLPFDQFLAAGEKVRGPLSEVPEFANATGNAAGLALIAARAAGASRVLLAGTGLRSLGGRSHVRGSGYDLYARMDAHRLKPSTHYRVATYKSERSRAHQHAWDTFLKQAKDDAIEVQVPPPLEARPTGQDSGTHDGRQSTLGPRRRTALRLARRPIRTDKLLEHLEQSEPDLPWDQLPLDGAHPRGLLRAVTGPH